MVVEVTKHTLPLSRHWPFKLYRKFCCWYKNASTHSRFYIFNAFNLMLCNIRISLQLKLNNSLVKTISIKFKSHFSEHLEIKHNILMLYNNDIRNIMNIHTYIFHFTLTLISNAPWIHLAISRRNIIRLLRNLPVILIKVFYVILCLSQKHTHTHFWKNTVFRT